MEKGKSGINKKSALRIFQANTFFTNINFSHLDILVGQSIFISSNAHEKWKYTYKVVDAFEFVNEVSVCVTHTLNDLKSPSLPLLFVAFPCYKES